MHVFKLPLKAFGEIPPVNEASALPERLDFTRARSAPEKGYWIRWNPVEGAVAFHIFRSRSVTMIDGAPIQYLWRGTYENVDLLSVAGDRTMVIDRYKLRGDLMFYVVLAQLQDGTLRPVQDLQVTSAGQAALNHKPLILEVPDPAAIAAAEAAARAKAEAEARARAEAEEKARAEAEAAERARQEAEAAAAAAAAEASRPKQLRPASIIPYKAPGKFQIVPPEEQGVQQYELYIGSVKPNAQHCDAFWDGGLHPSCQMHGYKLPGDIAGFTDKRTAEGNNVYLVLFAVLEDGSRVQPDLVAPSELPPRSVELT